MILIRGGSVYQYSILYCECYTVYRTESYSMTKHHINTVPKFSVYQKFGKVVSSKINILQYYLMLRSSIN